MENRFKRVIESLHQVGACPRLHIDLTRDGVVCPDFVIEKWRERLIIDLDPSYPLNLAFTLIGVEADLSFGGYVTRCTFPYASIYLIVDRATGRGAIFEENMPESIRRERGLTVSRPEPGPLPVPARDRGAGESRRRRRRPGAAESDEARGEAAAEDAPPIKEAPPPRALGLAAIDTTRDDDNDEPTESKEPEESAPETAQPDAASEPAASEPAAESSDRAAERRRAIFRVIDGGR